MDQIIQEFEFAFNPVRTEIENFNCLTQGKAMRRASEQENKKRPSIGGRSASNNSASSLPSFRRGSQTPASQTPISSVPEYPPSPPLSTTMSRKNSAIPVGNTALSPLASTGGDYFNPPIMPSPQLTPTPPGLMSFSPAGPKIDHFQSAASSRGTTPLDPIVAAIGKKKPPPPPRMASKPAFVTAIYDFDGQGAGDLVFREGDRIRVVRKTGSTDDWWEGELKGVKGAFPANYVE
jgi:hypothetical protein